MNEVNPNNSEISELLRLDVQDWKEYALELENVLFILDGVLPYGIFEPLDDAGYFEEYAEEEE